MNLRTRLAKLAAAVAEQAARDPAFAATLEGIMAGPPPAPVAGRRAKALRAEGARKGGRRAAAALDPIDLARSGPGQLREALAPLSHEQLLDVVAEYGMDPGKLVMKWKDRDRVADRIVEVATARATKGDAFRPE
ncbi:hypothetical protein [Sphingomonas sp. Leaf62]|uniref:hypothetical protein n=1 Tax=Sphingomonas sp. Leaf62 TaxID=1736228 RepID=UPI0006F509AD|nr:hypothetical protein [Sphingomonas sp. Leaf62]KQN80552.1 hypothetical protein ASE91_11200 [Sphingomonas sp. Leaf62]